MQEEDGYFFLDRLDMEWRNKTYRDFFAFSQLDFETTLAHLKKIPAIEELVYGKHEDDNGWWLQFNYCGNEFWVDTWHHGGATSLHTLDWECDDQILLALIACFAAMIDRFDSSTSSPKVIEYDFCGSP